LGVGYAYAVMESKTISDIGLARTPFGVELTLDDKRKVKG